MVRKREPKGQSWANLSINDDTIIDYLLGLVERLGIQIHYVCRSWVCRAISESAPIYFESQMDPSKDPKIRSFME